MTRQRLALVWLALLGSVWLALGVYDFWPCPQAHAPSRWPVGTRLALSDRVATLLVFLHPRCPCSRACVSELARLDLRCQGRLAVQVVIGLPPGVGRDWSETDLVRSAQATSEVHLDQAMVETTRFGVYTSGQALLYRPDGRLVFSGGITPSRGHEGSNAGLQAIEQAVAGPTLRLATTPVYGCQLCEGFCGVSPPSGSGHGPR